MAAKKYLPGECVVMSITNYSPYSYPFSPCSQNTLSNIQRKGYDDGAAGLNPPTFLFTLSSVLI